MDILEDGDEIAIPIATRAIAAIVIDDEEYCAPAQPPVVIQHRTTPRSSRGYWRPPVAQDAGVADFPVQHTSHVTLGDVFGGKLQSIAQNLADQQFMAYKVSDSVSSDSSFHAWIMEGGKHVGRYSRPRRTDVCYKNKKLAPAGPAFSKAELKAPCAEIIYPDHERFGPHAYLRVNHNRHKTKLSIDGKDVLIFKKGMFALMRHEGDFMTYRPCDTEVNVIDYPLVGKMSSDLHELSWALDPLHLWVVGREKVVDIWGIRKNSKKFDPFFLISVPHEDPTSEHEFVIILGTDEGGNVLILEFDLQGNVVTKND